jgi:hypothetical protein
MATATDYLSTYLDPIGDALTPEQARTILSTRPTDELLSRVAELAEKANDGTLNDQERNEYEYYINVDDTISVLKAKARHLLRNGSD